MTNPIIESLLNRKSIRKYTDEVPSDEVIETIARAGQQAPFATQSCSLILSRNRKKHAYLAPLQGQLREKGIDAHTSIAYGRAVDAILQTADSEDVDLIAMASHGRSGLSRVFHGSDAAGLLQRAHRPLRPRASQ